MISGFQPNRNSDLGTQKGHPYAMPGGRGKSRTKYLYTLSSLSTLPPSFPFFLLKNQFFPPHRLAPPPLPSSRDVFVMCCSWITPNPTLNCTSSNTTISNSTPSTPPPPLPLRSYPPPSYTLGALIFFLF